jgi:hypothetical protein
MENFNSESNSLIKIALLLSILQLINLITICILLGMHCVVY